jgi:hypothetical protein
LNRRVCSFWCLNGGVHLTQLCSFCAQRHLIPAHSSPLQPKCSAFALKAVTNFVTRQDRNGKEGTGIYRLNGTLQDLGIANEIGETVAIASFVRNGHWSLLISGPCF